MVTHNSENERIKRRYFAYVREAKRLADDSIDAAAAAIHQFEIYTRFKDFRAFHIEQAVGFKRQLATRLSEKTGRRLSKSTAYSTLMALREMFRWLAGQPGFRSRLTYTDAEYFNPSDADGAIAKATREGPVPTLEQIRHVLTTMPFHTEVEARNRAVVAFTLLTGARDRALASFKLKHVDLQRGCVFQDAREVRTKFSKTFMTVFFPVGDDVNDIVVQWIKYLTEKKHWGHDDPVFPKTRVTAGETRQFKADGLERAHWSNANPIRQIFKSGFTEAGLQYFNPHSFRKTIALLGQKRCRTPEEYKAWSQNLGHEDVLTTLRNYGEVALERQFEIIQSLGKPSENDPELNDAFQEFVRKVRAAERA